MRCRVPWLRVIGEVVVIVTSILLAFAIDAWWDSRQTRGAELETLIAVSEAVESARVLVRETMATIEQDQSRVTAFYSLPDRRLAALSPDSARLLLSALIRPDTEGFTRSPLAGLTTSGRSSMIRDSDVRTSLTAWIGDVEELEERAANLAVVELAVLEALGRHPAFERAAFNAGLFPNHSRNEDAESSTWDLRAIVADPVVRAAAAMMMFERDVYHINLRRILQRLDEIDGAVRDYRTGERSPS